MDTPAPTFLTLSSTPEWPAVALSDTKTLTVDLKITAPPCPELNERAPINLVAVVDTSGSMRGDKLNLVQDSLEFVFGQLKDKDTLSLVQFNSRANVDLSLRHTDKEGKQKALDACDKLRAGGGTSIHDGLKVGLDQLINSPLTKNNKTSCVLMFTDGRASKSGVIELIKPAVEKIESACTVSTFGYGTDHDSEFLRSIAESANGDYYFLEKPDDIPESFADALGGLLSVVAQNITLEIRPSADVKITKLLSNYPSEHVDGVWKVKMADLFGEEARDILVELEVGPHSASSSQNLFSSTVSYFNVLSSTLETCQPHFASVERLATVEYGTSNIVVDQQRNRVVVADVLTEARNVAKSDLPKAREILNKNISLIGASPSANTTESIRLVADMNEALEDMREKSHYVAFGEKKMQMKEQGHRKQRAKESHYGNAAKTEMKCRSAQASESLTEDRYARRAQASHQSNDFSEQKQTRSKPPNMSLTQNRNNRKQTDESS